MSIPIPDGPGVLLLAAVVAAVAVALRFVVFLPLLYGTGLDRRNAVAVSAKLAQVSEFCLVIVYLGARLGHLSATHVSVVIFAFVITALITPFLFGASDDLYLRLRGILDRLGMRSRGQRGEAERDQPPRLVLLGFHRVASSLLADLERLHPDLLPQTIVIDMNQPNHDEIRRRGVNVYYGDAASVDVLRHAGVDGAEVIVSTVPDELLRGTSNEQLVRRVRQVAPKAIVLANCTKISGVPALRAAGADYVFRAPIEVAAGVLAAVSAALNASLPSFIEAIEEERGVLETRQEVID